MLDFIELTVHSCVKFINLPENSLIQSDFQLFEVLLLDEVRLASQKKVAHFILRSIFLTKFQIGLDLFPYLLNELLYLLG